MARIIDQFPLIKAVYLDIVYDNGGVFNGMGHGPDRTEEMALDDSESVMGDNGVYHEDLQKLEDWLGTLTEEQRGTLATGEHDDVQALVEQSPRGGPDGSSVALLFEALFEVC